MHEDGPRRVLLVRYPVENAARSICRLLLGLNVVGLDNDRLVQLEKEPTKLVEADGRHAPTRAHASAPGSSSRYRPMSRVRHHELAFDT